MQQHARHPERIGDEARVLAAGAAKTAQRVFGDVVAALHRNVLDRIRHVGDGDLEEPVGDLLGRARAADPCGDLGRERRELLAHDLGIERLVAGRAEHAREELRIELADHHVAIGDGQRSTTPIRRRPGIRARRLRPDAKAGAVEPADRAAAGGDRVDAHHRRGEPHAGDLGDEGPLVLARVMRHVGRRATHVEADDAVETGQSRHLDRADDAARGAGQDRVLALEAMRVRQAAVRLHELQAGRAWRGGRAGIVPARIRRPRRGNRPFRSRELALDLAHVPAQDRRQVRIDDRRVAARDELHQRTHFVRDRHLREAQFARERRQRQLVLREAIAVHQDDRDGGDPGIPRGGKLAPHRREVERAHDLAACADPLVGLDHALVQQCRQLDPADEELGPILVGDPQRIGEALA